MKKNLNITATLYDPGLLRNLVEKLASRHVDMGYSKATVPQHCNAIESSSTIAYVMGTFDLETGNNKAPVSMPFTSCFLFTCTKEKYGIFSLEWSSSLS